jgi:hypothetical protein
MLEDLKYNLVGSSSKLLEGDSNVYPKQNELKRVLNAKVKVLSQMFELSRLLVLTNLIQKKIFNLSYQDVNIIEKEIDDVLKIDRWSQTQFVYQELKIWANNIRHL